MSADADNRSRSSHNLLVRFKALSGAFEDIDLAPQFNALLDQEDDPGEKCSWLPPDEQEGPFLTAIREGERARWVLWYMDSVLVRQTDDENEPEVECYYGSDRGKHLPDDVEGEEVAERDAAAWLDAKGYDLPPTLVGRILAGKPETGAASPSTATGSAASPRERTEAPAGLGGASQRPAASGQDHATRRQAREAKVAEYLREHPDATAKKVYEKTGVPEGTVRNTDAWTEHRAGRKAEKPAGTRDALDRPRPLADAMLAVRPSDVSDPSEIAAEREELDDPESLGDMELLRRRYIEGANSDQRARFNQMTREDQEHELQAWRWSGVRLAE
jgi:hypothetical protein